NDIGNFQYGFFTGNGAAVGWNADTAHLVDEGSPGTGSYHLTMIFGGGEFLMELMDIITDEQAFDAAWLDFCRLFNASNADKIARYGISFDSGGFSQLYAKLQCYAGQRLNDTTLKQTAWNIITSNTVGVWPPVTQVGGTDVLNPINEIANLATNDAGALSLSEYAVMAIAPELSPNSFSSMTEEWDQSTIAEYDHTDKKSEEYEIKEHLTMRKKGRNWRKLLWRKTRPYSSINNGNTFDTKDFHIHRATGFIPSEAPLARLPVKFEAWEIALDDAVRSKLQ
ncbi:hypothetical protein H0H93_011143, partial [Arthromyces matolae]